MKAKHIAAGTIATVTLGFSVMSAQAHPAAGSRPGMEGGMHHGATSPHAGRAASAGKHHLMTPEERTAPLGGPMAGRTQHDDAFAADMHLVRDLVHRNERIKRTVTNLANGIETVTESDDPQVAQSIKAHVASMTQRLSDGKEFNLFSRTIPVLFENRDKIKTVVETTDKGSIVTQTSGDTKVVAALQAHAAEVDELVRDGMVAMMRNMRANMAGMQRGPRSRFSR